MTGVRKKRGDLDTETHTDGGRDGVMLPQAKESQRRPANQQKTGERAWTRFFLTASKETIPADTLISDL